MRQITSKDNPNIKEYVRLCGSRKSRTESGCFVLEGMRLVCDAHQSGVRIGLLLVTEEGMARLGERFAALSDAAGETVLIDRRIAGQIAQTKTPQGVFAVCEGALWRGEPSSPPALGRGALLLCSLQDPGNVGTIIRSAEAFGLSAVLMSADCPDPASPKVLRASMGAALRLPLYRCPDPAETVGRLREAGIPVFAAALGERSVPVGEVSLRGAVVAVGNEGAGLSEEFCARCDRRVILPIAPGSESLNAAMAASIFAWELSRAARGEENR